MRTAQGGGRGEQGAEQGEEMHAAVFNPPHPPTAPPSLTLLFHSSSLPSVLSLWCFSMQIPPRCITSRSAPQRNAAKILKGLRLFRQVSV